jgi:hypothetical protein
VVLSNSQCEVYVKDVVITRAGADLSVGWSVKLKPTMAGKTLGGWMIVYDMSNAWDGWTKLGAYTTP